MALADISELTQGVVGGNGAFDKLMDAAKAHIQQEFQSNRLRGPEYAEVYLGMLQNSMNTALSWLVQGANLDLQRELLEQQVILAKIEAEKAEIEKANLLIQQELLELQKPKLAAEVELIQAQVIQMEAENALIPKKAALMDAEVLYKEKQGELITAQVENEKVQKTVLVAQECKLRAEFDLTMNQVTKTTSEIGLLTQKTMTEKAQTQAMGVDPDSVIGRQKTLYTKQADGFDRDAEQKAAKLMIDTWNARRMTDDATVADGTNQLNDVNIGKFVSKLAQGIGA